MSYEHVMIDLETLGTRPGSVILSIGAVAFDEGQPESTWSKFDSGPISVAGSRAAGLTIDESTLAWWLRQDDEPRKLLLAALDDAAQAPIVALNNFVGWSPYPAEFTLWSNGANFDGVLLRAAWEKVCPQYVPICKYYQECCYRTMKRRYARVSAPMRQGVHHNALNDALHQTRHLQSIFAVEREARKS